MVILSFKKANSKKQIMFNTYLRRRILPIACTDGAGEANVHMCSEPAE
jgi:hypothetical protein